jgi:flavin reductase (DIM6/NTAB) family NADH-FMN oxidoreductase RutF
VSVGAREGEVAGRADIPLEKEQSTPSESEQPNPSESQQSQGLRDELVPDESKFTVTKYWTTSGSHEKGTSSGSEGPQHSQPQTSLPDRLRGLMRHVPSSVVVITAAHSIRKPDGRRWRVPLGIAVSSFNTVTLTPPHISFNIKFPSKTLDAIRNAKGLFRVHFLSATEQSRSIVDLFTIGNNSEAYSLRHHHVPMSMPKGRVQHQSTPSLAPQIQGPSVVAALECELTQELLVADHVVAVAKVNSMVKGQESVGTLLYHQGAYKRPDGAILKKLQQDISLQAKLGSEAGKYWSYPLFPGAAERDDFVNFARDYLRRNPGILNKKHILRELKSTFALPTSNWGIEWSRLIEQCRVEAGHPPSYDGSSKDWPLLFEFYGPLSPRDIAVILERARKLVLAEPDVLACHYLDFFAHLSYSTMSRGLLAGDILDQLRSDGLVTHRSSLPPSLEDLDDHVPIERLEDIEVKLRSFINSQEYSTFKDMSDEDLAQAIGSKALHAKRWVGHVRSRLAVEAFPKLFDSRDIDIKGELTPEEVRVLVHRVTQYLNVTDSFDDLGLQRFRTRAVKEPRLEVLRKLGIHPLISGIDFEFLFKKLEFLRNHSINPDECRIAVEDMLAPMFERRVFEWAELERRVRELVRNCTLQALRWSREDHVAAMGLHRRSKIKTPLSPNKPQITDTHMLEILFAKELKTFYSHNDCGAVQKEAIRAYLRTRYNYDIVDTAPVSDTPSFDAGGGSATTSADEMQKAMLKSLNVHVRQEDRDKLELSATTSAEEYQEAMLNSLGVKIRPQDRQKMELSEALADFGFDNTQAKKESKTDDR